jgi:hypothetical protein
LRRIDGLQRERVTLRTGRVVTVLRDAGGQRVLRPWERYPQHGAIGSFIVSLWRNIFML